MNNKSRQKVQVRVNVNIYDAFLLTVYKDHPLQNFLH